MTKHFFIGILLLSMSMVCSGQEATIDFYYDKQKDSIIIKISNNTENKMIIRDQDRLDQFSGSFVFLQYLYDGEQSMRTMPLFEDIISNGHINPFKPLDPKQKLDFSRSINSYSVKNIKIITLHMTIFITDKNSGKVTTQYYYKEVDIK